MDFDLSGLASYPQTPEECVKYLREGMPPLIQLVSELSEMLDATNVAPSKPREGMIRYADGTNWNPGSGAGIYRYTSGAWVLVSNLQGGYGCVPFNNGSDATNALDFTAGAFWDDTHTILLQAPALTGKQLDANWAAGSAAGLRDSASAIGNFTYHVYLIAKAQGASADYFAVKNGDTVTLPTDYIYKRRIFSFYRLAGANVLFYASEINGGGLETRLSVPVRDHSSNGGVTTYTTQQSITLASVPVGVPFWPIAYLTVFDNTPASATFWLAVSNGQANTVPSATVYTTITTAQGATVPALQVVKLDVRLDTSARFALRASATDADRGAEVMTHGWIDARVS